MMPSGFMPTYDYRPPPNQPVAFLRTASALRGRLFAGGTYFRSRDVGLNQNRISVQVIQYAAPDSPQPDGVCVVTNYNLLDTENVTGPAKPDIFFWQLDWNDVFEIDQLHTPSPRLRYYSISLQIGAPAPTYQELGFFSFSKLLSVPGKIAVKLVPNTSVFTPADRIIITNRRAVHRLQPISLLDNFLMQTVTVWDIQDLRDKVNATNPWIEMLPRSGVDPLNGPNFQFDVQDDGIDATGLSPFAETRLSGGDGLPPYPSAEQTGPTRSLIHINYSERQNGSLGETNVVYEWVGNSSDSGGWQAY
jgi:hypothetical protein